MGKPLSILCVHGIGHQELDPDLESSWTDAIVQALQTFDPAAAPAIDFLQYDALFDHAPLDLATYGEAMAKLMATPSSTRSATCSRRRAISASFPRRSAGPRE